MSYWTLLQATFDVFAFAAIAVMFWRIRRPPQDDPRLSRGLQLLQTKITVLEDLSDRTEAQVKQLTGLIDQKTRALQNKVIEAEQQIIKIDHTMGKTGDAVAQESLPPAEAAERERTVLYVRAAKLANAGHSVEHILKQVSLPREQVELIAKFNRDQLMFDETALPEWATRPAAIGDIGLGDIDFVGNLDKPRPDFQQIARIEGEFKRAVETRRRADAAAEQSLMETKMAETIRASINSGMETMQPAVLAVKATAQTLREKLVATAEDVLRNQQLQAAAAKMSAAANETANFADAVLSHAQSQEPATTATPATTAPAITTPASTPPVKTTAFNIGASNTIVKNEKATVKKVIFPRIEKPTM